MRFICFPRNTPLTVSRRSRTSACQLTPVLSAITSHAILVGSSLFCVGGSASGLGEPVRRPACGPPYRPSPARCARLGERRPTGSRAAGGRREMLLQIRNRLGAAENAVSPSFVRPDQRAAALTHSKQRGGYLCGARLIVTLHVIQSLMVDFAAIADIEL